MGKRILSAVLAVLLALSLAPMRAYAMSESEAVEWVRSQVGKTIGNGQCTRLAEAYTWRFFGFMLTTSPKDYPSHDLPEGWLKIRYHSGFTPAPGDIAVWQPGRGAWGWIADTGHTAIVISATESALTSVDQNWGTDGNGSAARIVTHSYNSFWGVLRPPFNGNEGHQIPVQGLSASDLLYTASDWAREGIASAISKGIVSVNVAYNFGGIIDRAQFCQLAVKWLEYKTGKGIGEILAERGLTLNPNAFADTADPDILAAYALGITSGTVAPTATRRGTFSPRGQFDRQQAAAMIMNTCRAAGMDMGSPPTAPFADLREAESWAISGINFVYANGIMNGTSANPPLFSPLGKYTRQESIVTFDRMG